MNTQAIFSDNLLRAHCREENGILVLALYDAHTGELLGKSSLLEVEIHDKMQRRMDVLHGCEVKEFESSDSTLHITVRDAFRQISVGLWLEIRDGELVATLHPTEIYEDRDALFRLFAVNLLPGLMRAGNDGFLLLPVTSGVLCRPANKPKLSDRFMIYGEQERWELLPTLPFCAASTPNGGLMALATKGACDTQCRVATDGEGNGEVGFAYSLRRHWIDPVDFAEREIRVIPIPKDRKAEVFCAKRIRRHVMQDQGKLTLAQRVQESPEVKDLLSSYVMKIFHASPRDSGLFSQIMQPQRGQSTSPLDIWTTFDEAKKCLQKLHAAGVANITTQSVGWNPRGHDGLYPTRLPPEPRLGGEAGFRDLLEFGRSLGYRMSVHDNYMDGYKASPDFDLETTIHDVYGEPLVSGLWGGGINHRQWPLSFSAERLSGQMRRVQELGINGMYYIDAMGNPLEVNYHPRHGGPRSGHAAGIERVLVAARELFGSVGTECGFLYACLPADCMVMVGYDWDLQTQLRPDWPLRQLCDKKLPIWHLAMHGLIAHEGHGLTWHSIMEKVLLGHLPRAEWSARPGMFPVLDERLVQCIKADYDLTLGRFGYLQTFEMTDYEESSDVAESRFEDGTNVLADWKSSKLFVNNTLIANTLP